MLEVFFVDAPGNDGDLGEVGLHTVVHWRTSLPPRALGPFGGVLWRLTGNPTDNPVPLRVWRPAPLLCSGC